ncbi:hypothetical protein J8A87_21905 [Vibrio parahaemolyticus]|uniref:hypothetical protein n=1 Tax=Vibrio TaxID=662 RepID=UPI0029656451|nr:hypothetical protein [Vibrio sp. Vb0587]MBE4779679.1 hypothetical protein [Vibrio parahaemolyticus]MCF9167106.1 hypothetical protein [Vibrio parahaemolyticus]MDG3410138.1 hypothetical protein [Vibrio parahaemolyticus]MDW1965478.1 hypothetical protein [Vibrio sp. Vb0587]
MFNLIISIIAIALVVVLAGASLYYGGDAFNRGSSDAKAATLINQAQQIQAAAKLFSAIEGGEPASINDLQGSYLSSIPTLPIGTDSITTWQFSTELNDNDEYVDLIMVEVPFAAKTEDGITKNICKTVNKNGAGIVFCSISYNGVFHSGNMIAGTGATDSDVDLLYLENGKGRARIHINI